MVLEPVKYKRIDLEPVGIFTAQMTDNGWAQTKYENKSETHILYSDEVAEFFKLVDKFFRECSDWEKLQKYIKKYGTNTLNCDGITVSAINFEGTRMLYTFQFNGPILTAFPYRTYKH